MFFPFVFLYEDPHGEACCKGSMRAVRRAGKEAFPSARSKG